MGENSLYLLLGLGTFILSVVLTRAIRKWFFRFRSQEHKAGKELIYRHFPRQKKPLGGGVAIFISITAGVVVMFLASMLSGVQIVPKSGIVWSWLLCGIFFGLIGLIDDWRKVNAARGLKDWAKLLMQTALAFVFTIVLVQFRGPDSLHATAVFFPFVGWLQLGYLFVPFSMLVLIGASNAVNLTDGLDGLAGTGLLLSFAGFLVLGALLHHEAIPVVIPVLALASLAGFLVFNHPPAKIIMGDAGALGLGAALGALALVSRTEWLLLLFGAPFIIDTLSVLIQVTVIKFFRGPVQLLRHQTTEIFRPFLCTPLHHHFQWLTWGPWPILALFSGVGALSVMLGLLALPAKDGSLAAGWFWLVGLLLQALFLVFAAMQKIVRANYFLGLERPEGNAERMLALFKGLPVQVFGVRWYTLEEITGITEVMVSTIAAESILWRNISEIEARATLGKVYAEYKMLDQAAAEWEEIPLRNLLIRENLVVQLGKIYFGRDELLRAIKLWEELPPSRLAAMPGLPETIQSAKVRIGHLAGRLYHQAKEHTAALRRRISNPANHPPAAEVTEITAELEAALRYTQDLRDLLAHEQHKAESAGELTAPGDGQDLYRRMDAMLAARRDELNQAANWVRELVRPLQAPEEHTPLDELAKSLHMTPAEVRHALEVKGAFDVREFTRMPQPSRNTLYRVMLGNRDAHLPEQLVAKCYEDTQVTFFSACYRRERGVLQILHEAHAPVPRPYGGHLGSHMGVLFLEDFGAQSLSAALRELAPDNRAGRIDLLRQGLETLVMLRSNSLPVLPRLEREIAKIVKEVLTPEYYLNSTTIALNRILALNRKQLSATERGRLEVALQPLTAVLLDEPRTFIHFEYTPVNLQRTDSRVVALDFEQSTMGPAAFDVATLLYAPEADLTDDEARGLLDFYHGQLDATTDAPIIEWDALEAAAIMKLLFYAGSAANFYRKFEEGRHLHAMDWYLQTVDRLLQRNMTDYRDLSDILRKCWDGQQRLPV